jgi:hypothetical protein
VAYGDKQPMTALIERHRVVVREAPEGNARHDRTLLSILTTSPEDSSRRISQRIGCLR